MDANGRSIALEHDQWDASIQMRAAYASKTDFEQFFPNGDFTFDLSTLDDGPQSVTLSLGATDDYPAAPTITNLPALQTINPATPTTITWTALDGWSPTIDIDSEMIELEFDNSQGNEIYWVNNGDLSSNSQYVIPADTLWPGRTYRVNLIFTKIKDLDDASYPDVKAGAGFSSITEFTIQTIGNPDLPKVTLQKNGNIMNLNCTGGEPQRSYVVEASSDLKRWLVLQETWLDGSAYTYYDNDARYLESRFYRLRDRLAEEQVQYTRIIQGTVWTDSTHTTPVAGAMVGTSMDTETTLTDNNGRFFLETDTQDGSGEYTVGVTSGAIHKDFGPFLGDQPREQHYQMN
jgi:hypothetical protein